MSEDIAILTEGKPVQQITDQRTLRKLLRRLNEEEVSGVKFYLERLAGIDTDKPCPTTKPFSLNELLELKKVKENQHMTAMLKEIGAYVDVGNNEAAIKAAKRVLEAEPVKAPEKFVKEHVAIKETNSSA